MICRSLRRLQKAYQREITEQKVNLLFWAATKLTAQQSIATHEKTGLLKSLQIEKKKRKQGKKLNIPGREETGEP